MLMLAINAGILGSTLKNALMKKVALLMDA
jgi:hypothetical protein